MANTESTSEDCNFVAEQPDLYANVYTYCGANASGCTIASLSNITNFSFGECACSVQSNLTSAMQQPRQIAYRPMNSVSDPQTSVASGDLAAGCSGGCLIVKLGD
jgi:hypothetical protein